MQKKGFLLAGLQVTAFHMLTKQEKWPIQKDKQSTVYLYDKVAENLRYRWKEILTPRR